MRSLFATVLSRFIEGAQRLGLATALTLTALSAHAGQFQVLHTFDTPGQRPLGGLTAVGDTLFGTTAAIWTSSNPPPFGYIFSLNRDGSNYQVLHEFAGAEGANSENSMTLVGGKLVGTTAGRRASQPATGNGGTLFSINPDGSGFQVLREFLGGFGGARAPVVASGSKLYSTMNGGSRVFSTDADGSNLEILHEFSGYKPSSGLTLVGSTLYGTTEFGGANDDGVVYSVDTDGAGFQVLYEFANRTSDDGGQPMGELTRVGSTLYGTTVRGGEHSRGTIWSINLDGSDYTVLHSFGGASGDQRPEAGLTLFESTLYGVADDALFSITLDGTGYEVLYELRPTDGQRAASELVRIGSTLYGTATFGGAGPNFGTVFAYTIPEPTSIALAAVGLLGLVAVVLRRMSK